MVLALCIQVKMHNQAKHSDSSFVTAKAARVGSVTTSMLTLYIAVEVFVCA